MSQRLNLFLLATVPVLLFAASMVAVVLVQANALTMQVSQLIEDRIVASKQSELQNYAELAETALRPYLESGGTTGEELAQAKRVLNSMTFGADGYFFVYDFEGLNLVHPRLPELVGQNLWELEDSTGNQLIQGLIQQAQNGGGFHSYIWNKPSTGALEQKISYAIGIDQWGWMLGTGLYLDDIASETTLATNAIQTAVFRSSFWLLGFALLAVLAAGTVVYLFQFNLQRSADQKLKAVNARIVDIQEEQSQRISRDLHDGVSQLLVLTRYGVEAAEAGLSAGQIEQKRLLERSRGSLDRALTELRSVARSLRPPALDQLGLQDALNNLVDDFEAQSDLRVESDIEAMGDSLSERSKSALFRVAQEALTNVSKHAKATHVWIKLERSEHHAVLSVRDNGIGVAHASKGGLGIANMQERLASLGGSLSIERGALGGTLLIGKLPTERGEDRA